MNALIINCSPVRTGATAEIARIVTEQLSARYEYRGDVEPRKKEIMDFCMNI